MQRFTTVAEYNAALDIAPPSLDFLDVQSFAECLRGGHLQMPPFRHSFYQIALLESGSGTVMNNHHGLELDNYTLFFVAPDQVISWDVRDDWKGYYCSFTPEGYSVVLDGYPTLDLLPFFQHPHPGIHLEKEEATRLLEAMKRIRNHYLDHDNRHRGLMVKAEISLLLAECLSAYDLHSARQAARPVGNSVTERFARYVRTAVSDMVRGARREAITAGDCAANLFVSGGYLAECTRRDLGVRPTEYIHQTLVAEAKKLLLTTEDPIVEVARRLRFSSLAYFGRVFRKLEGVSPSAYRAAQNG